MATLREYFDTDHSQALKLGNEINSNRDGVARPSGSFQLCVETGANANYVACWTPAEWGVPSLMELLASVDTIKAELLSQVDVLSSLPGDLHPQSSKDTKFTGRVFIYAEAPISVPDADTVIAQGKALGFDVVMRLPIFGTKRSELEHPLAFLSHDSRDKEFVRQVAIECAKLMCPVWYDEFKLTPGDSLRDSIERGLKRCKKCVFVLTPHFLANGGWAKTEYTSIFTRELVERENVIVPVWHGVSQAEVYEYSPILADRVAITQGTAAEIAARIARAVRE